MTLEPVIRRGPLSFLLLFFAIVLAVPTGVIACQVKLSRDQREVQRVGRAFCETLLPRLEEFKLVHGVYPASIDDFLLPSDSLPPILLEPWNKNNWYRKDETGQSFMFSIYSDPDALEAWFAPNIYYYTSEDKRWGGSTG